MWNLRLKGWYDLSMAIEEAGGDEVKNYKHLRSHPTSHPMLWGDQCQGNNAKSKSALADRYIMWDTNVILTFLAATLKTNGWNLKKLPILCQFIS